MTKKSDIRVPEGYFEDLQERLLTGRTSARRPFMQRVTPYLAYAAMLAFALVVGTAILRKTAAIPADEDVAYNQYMHYLAMSMDTDGAVYSFDDYDLTRQDLVDYLIDEGISVDQLNYVNHEEDY